GGCSAGHRDQRARPRPLDRWPMRPHEVGAGTHLELEAGVRRELLVAGDDAGNTGRSLSSLAALRPHANPPAPQLPHYVVAPVLVSELVLRDEDERRVVPQLGP